MKLLRSNRGFTLLEILVSIAIIGIALTVILQLFSSNLRALSVSKDYVNASIKAEEIMRELLEEDLSEGHRSEQTEDGYKIDIDIHRILEDKTENLQVEMMQIDLTIRWTSGLKDKRIDFTTSKVIEKAI
jgi:prepilin-type N-terminal cleavage/methylation domain-containing protein